MKTFKRISLSTAIAIALASCSTAPDYKSTVNDLDAQYSVLASHPHAEEHAPIAVEEAREAVDKVKKMVRDGKDKNDIAHQAYLAERKIEIAQQLTRMGESKALIETSEVRRKDILLQSKDSKIQQAALAAATAELRADEAGRKNQALEDEIKQSKAETEKMREQFNSAEQKMKALGDKLEGVSTESNERGLVITMADIEFATGKHELSEGSASQLREIATFLEEFPDRDVLVEGYTDSTGSSQYNDNLSELRAQSVMEKLRSNGVDRSRLQYKGYGEKFPIASNDSSQGRQANRRVEIVLAKDAKETVSARDNF